MASLMKESIQLGLAYSFRDFVHCRDHGGIQADIMVLRFSHSDSQGAVQESDDWLELLTPQRPL